MNHDVSFVRVSRAPLAKIRAFNERMGWHAKWVDITPKGHNKTGPHHTLMDWARHHDKYGFQGFVDVTTLYQTGKISYETQP